MSCQLKAPFPWFGGKSRAAELIWSRFGDIVNYVEPFAGSLAVLWERPASHRSQIETVNDADHYLANLWRAISADPEAVAAHCDWPVNEDDLHARHAWLVREGRERLRRIVADPTYYDAQIAGWWVWGQCSWIGGGWCAGKGPWSVASDGLLSRDAGRGINRKLPHLSSGRGINRQLPHLNAGQGEVEEPPVYGYLRALSARLRHVRVCCGDWSRIVTPGALSYGSSVGVLLDPPYSGDMRARELYSVDDHNISAAVAEWARAHGADRRLRIAVCGYEGEHDLPGWKVVAWKAHGGYGNISGNENRKKERIWFSPHCLNPELELSFEHVKV